MTNEKKGKLRGRIRGAVEIDSDNRYKKLLEDNYDGGIQLDRVGGHYNYRKDGTKRPTVEHAIQTGDTSE